MIVEGNTLREESGMLANGTRKFGIEIEAIGGTTTKDRVAEALEAVGIEVQVREYTHTTTSYWKLVQDSSLTGRNTFELVSPPLAGENGLEEIRKACQVLNSLGVTVNSSCGLHVHHDASDFQVDTFKRLFALYYRFEATIDSLVSPSRRGNTNRYCHSLRTIYGGATRIAEVKTLRELEGILWDRYYKLNFQAYWRHGTVEFRQHQGSVNASEIIQWITLTQLMVERSVSSSTLKVDTSREDSNLVQLRRVLTRPFGNGFKELFRYLRQRQAELAA